MADDVPPRIGAQGAPPRTTADDPPLRRTAYAAPPRTTAHGAPPYLTAPVGMRRSQQRPSLALRALSAQLREHGLSRLYLAACARFGVLSVAPGVTVWTNGRMLWWQAGDDETTWPAADAPGAARRLAELAAPGQATR